MEEKVSPDAGSAALTARIGRFFGESERAVAFTGAGISTESGIADFRSPGGVWSRYQPVLFQDFLASAAARRRFWQMKKEGDRELRSAKTNAGHRALARLESAGRLQAVITQNIDGLHQDAGSSRVLEQAVDVDRKSTRLNSVTL